MSLLVQSESMHPSDPQTTPHVPGDSTSLNSEPPAINLPAEILHHIFIYACIRPWNAIHIPFYSREPAGSDVSRSVRNAISATCVRWREAVLSCPTLWCYISVQFIDMRLLRHSPNESNILRPHPALLALELERARQRPLHIKLACMGSPLWWEESLQHIRTAMKSCQTLEIEDSGWDCIHQIIPQEAKNQPELHSLHTLTLRSPTDTHLDFTSLTGLRHVFVKKSLSLSIPPGVVRLGFPNPKDMNPTSESLRHCLSLQQLKIPLAGLFTSTSDVPIHFLKLRELSLVGRLTDDILPITASWFKAEQLRYLQLHHVTALVVIESFPSLETLDIVSMVHEAMLIGFLQQQYCSNIKELILPHTMQCGPSLADALTKRDSLGRFEAVPHLQRLSASFVSAKLANQVLTARLKAVDSMGPTFILFSRANFPGSTLLDKWAQHIRPIVYEDPFDPQCWVRHIDADEQED